MIEKIKHVYYCEHCKKRYFLKSAAIKHEKHCTLNPNRECRMCNIISGGGIDIKPLIKKYETIFNERFPHYPKLTTEEIYDHINDKNTQWGEEIINQIKTDVDGCPICTLTIIRQTNIGSVCYYKELKNDVKQVLENNYNDERQY